jgi:hypothetical protein
VIVIGFFVIRWAATPAPSPPPKATTETMVASLVSLPASTQDSVGRGSVIARLRAADGAPLIGPTGKPEVFYDGAEYCPFCAAMRWPLIISLARFGTFSGLKTTTSAANDVYPNTPTFTFVGSTYQSQYVDFVPVEEFGNKPAPGGGYNRLRTPTAEQAALIQKYDAPPYTSSAGGIPFMDLGNRRVLSGATYQPDALQNLSWQQIVDLLHDPNSVQARAILGTANLITAAICEITADQPAGVCSSPTIKAIQRGG